MIIRNFRSLYTPLLLCITCGSLVALKLLFLQKTRITLLQRVVCMQKNMCGILSVLCRHDSVPEDVWTVVNESLKHRGPDGNSETKLVFPNGLYLHMHFWVLHLRGAKRVLQPYINSKGDVLQWNGDIFGGIQVGEYECDTVVLAEKLAECTSDSEICQLFSNLEGPWSFVFYQKCAKKLWFGRDYFGRRSLLWQGQGDKLVLSSVARKHNLECGNIEEWFEVPAHGLYCVDLGNREHQFQIAFHPWGSVTQSGSTKINVLKSFLADQNLLLDTYGKMNCPFQSIEVPIKPFKTGDYLTLEINVSEQESNTKTLKKVLEKKIMYDSAANFIDILQCAVKKRVINVPKKCEGASSIGVLFSGGIDCTILALMADKFVPKNESIDLLNVAFETIKHGDGRQFSEKYDVPDRLNGRSSLKELQSLCPDRIWNFIEVDVSLNELKSTRQNIIADLTYPLRSVLDDSIGCAIWFASRGEGMLKTGESTQPYKCESKVLLCGMGADEQLGGYSRHRSAYEKSGWDGLANEIKMEVERISFRNLGRDNRIIADHGRDARLPYLDENVVSFLNQTPLPLKADLKFKRGVGEKILLRIAALMLGLKSAAVLPKRAIQFGSRIAKAECRKEKASDICPRLL